jgi:plastocyanin
MKNSYKILIALLIIIAVGALVFIVFYSGNNKEYAGPDNNIVQQPNQENNQEAGFVFENLKKSAHYESNTPEHAAVLAGVPINIVIDFNFDLHSKSTISIMHNGAEYGVGNTKIDDNKLAMRRSLDLNSPDGIYTVNYNACWPDESCHDGSFQFAINRSESKNFIDMRNISEITIKMMNFVFDPKNVIINKGTTVTWVNNDSAGHFINTDSHPAHTYYPPQNSKELNKDDTFSLKFDIPGIYPYHCSAHPGTMTGYILVE